MGMLSVARGWFSCGRRSTQSHTAAVKKARDCCGNTVAVRLLSTASMPAVQRFPQTDAHSTGETPSREPVGAVPLLGSLLPYCSPHVVDTYDAAAGAVPTAVAYRRSAAAFGATRLAAAELKSILRYYKLASAVSCFFGAARCYSTTASAGQGSCCRPVCGEAAEHFPPCRTIGRQRHAALILGSQGCSRRLFGGVKRFSGCILAPLWRWECDGRHDDELKKQQEQRPATVSCSSALDTSGRSEIAGMRTFGNEFPLYDLHVRPTSAKPACGAAEGLHCIESSRRRRLRLSRCSVLSKLRPVCVFSQRRSCTSAGGALRAVALVPAGAHTMARAQHPIKSVSTTPRLRLVPADEHAAARCRQHRKQLLYMLRWQQPCLKIAGLVQKIPELAAAVLVSCPFLQAYTVINEGHWPGAGACQLLSGACRDRRCGNGKIEEDYDKQRPVVNVRMGALLRHLGGRLLKCGSVQELEKIGRGTKWDDLLDLHLLPGCSGQVTARRLQSSMSPFSRGAGEPASATGKRRSLALESDTARRAVEGAQSAPAVLAALSTERPPPHERILADTPAAPTVISTHAGAVQVCTGATTETEATLDRATAAASANSVRTAEADNEFAGIAETGAKIVRETTDGGELPPGRAAGGRGWKMLQRRAFAPPETPVGGSIPAASTWRLPASLTTQNVGRWNVAGQRQQHEASNVPGVLHRPTGWMPSAYYSSCSGSTAETLGKGTRRSRAPFQLSRKELKGLQGHPRRYQLMGGRPEFHHVDRNKNGHIIEPTDKFQVVMTTSKNNVHVQVLNKARAYRTIFGSFAGNVGYRKRAQQEPQCAYRIGQNIARKCRRLGIRQVDVKFRRIMRVEQLLQAFAAHGLGVTSITHEPRLPKCGQNSTKPRKRRRV